MCEECVGLRVRYLEARDRIKDLEKDLATYRPTEEQADALRLLREYWTMLRALDALRKELNSHIATHYELSPQ